MSRHKKTHLNPIEKKLTKRKVNSISLPNLNIATDFPPVSIPTISELQIEASKRPKINDISSDKLLTLTNELPKD